MRKALPVSDEIVSLIRTYVPLAVGAALVWLANTAGIKITEDESAGLTAGLTALTAAGYYALARWLESRWPWLGKLLGTSRRPTYTEPHHVPRNL